MLRNGQKSRRPKKISLLLKRHRYARLKFVRQHKKRKIRFGKEYYGQMKLKLSCSVIIIKIGGVMVIVAGYGHGDTSSNPGPD